MNFNTNIENAGGYERIAKIPLSRNLWAIAKKFETLPSDPIFQDLTEPQVNWIISNMGRDADLEAMAARGIDVNSMYESEDTDWWYQDIDDFNPAEGLEGYEDYIAQQVEDLTKEQDKEKLAKITEDADQYAQYLEDGGPNLEERETDRIIQRKIEEARREAQEIESQGGRGTGKTLKEMESEKETTQSLETQKAIDDMKSLFDGEDDSETYLGSPDDGFI